MRKIVAGVGLTILLLATLAACGPAPLDAKQTAVQWLDAMSRRDAVAAYNLLSADARATIPTAEMFKEMIDKSWTDANLTSFQVKTVQDPVLQLSGTRASVAYEVTLTTSDGTSTDVYNALSLVLQDGQWRVIWPPVR